MRRPFNGSYRVTQSFGENPNSYKQFNIKGHDGVDYGLPVGTPVLAPHTGTVIESGELGGYGFYVKIQNDVEGSVLAHLSRRDVAAGTKVQEGQQVGLSGGAKGAPGAGNSTGPHLHWGYYRIPRQRGNGFDGFIDQWPFLDAATPQPAETPLTDQQEQEMYQVVLGRTREVPATGRSAYRFILDARPELEQKRQWLADAIVQATSQQKQVDALTARVGTQDAELATLRRELEERPVAPPLPGTVVMPGSEAPQPADEQTVPLEIPANNSNQDNKKGDGLDVEKSNWLEGKKTYIGIAAGAVYSVLIALGYVESNELVWTAIGTYTGISFRLALKKEK